MSEWLASGDVAAFHRDAVYHKTVQRIANGLVAAAVRDRVTPPEVALELSLTAQAEIGLFIDRRVNRFPRLGAQLMARFTDTLLPLSTWKALKRVVHRAIVDRARHLGMLECS